MQKKPVPQKNKNQNLSNEADSLNVKGEENRVAIVAASQLKEC